MALCESFKGFCKFYWFYITLLYFIIWRNETQHQTRRAKQNYKDNDDYVAEDDAAADDDDDDDDDNNNNNNNNN